MQATVRIRCTPRYGGAAVRVCRQSTGKKSGQHLTNIHPAACDLQLPPPALDLYPMFVRGLLASVEVRNVPDLAGYPHHLVVAGPRRGQAHLRVGPNLRAVSSLQQSAEPSRRLLVATSRHVAATCLCTAKVRRVC